MQWNAERTAGHKRYSGEENDSTSFHLLEHGALYKNVDSQHSPPTTISVPLTRATTRLSDAGELLVSAFTRAVEGEEWDSDVPITSCLLRGETSLQRCTTSGRGRACARCGKGGRLLLCTHLIIQPSCARCLAHAHVEDISVAVNYFELSTGSRLLLREYGQVSGRDDCCHVSYSGVTLMLSLFPPAEKTIGEWHDELCATKFFFGRISTQDAAALLSEQGRYLLRCSSVAGAVTISVGLGHSRVKHWRIGRSEKGGFIVIYRTRKSEAEETYEFATLWEALRAVRIAYRMVDAVGPSPYRLRMPPDVRDPSGS